MSKKFLYDETAKKKKKKCDEMDGITIAGLVCLSEELAWYNYDKG